MDKKAQQILVNSDVIDVKKSPSNTKAHLYKTLQQLSSSSNLIGEYVRQKFPNEEAI
jgi:hypothetical protein